MRDIKKITNYTVAFRWYNLENIEIVQKSALTTLKHVKRVTRVLVICNSYDHPTILYLNPCFIILTFLLL